MNSRQPRAEQEVIRQARDVLRFVVLMKPSNPADAERIHWLGTEGVDLVELACRAIGRALAGPRVDLDYIDDALGAINTAKKGIPPVDMCQP